MRILGAELPYGRILIISLVAGLIARAVLIPFTSSPFDIAAGWAAVIEEIYAGHSLYDGELYKYTPVWGYVLAVISYIANLLGMTSFGDMFTTIYPSTELTFGYGFITNPRFNILVKMPGLVFDVLAAFASYRFVKDVTGSGRKGEIAFAAWFLCPMVVMSSAILGMFDSMMFFFMIESAIQFRKRRMLLAGTLISLSILTKAFPAMLLPVMIAYVLGDRDRTWGLRFKDLGLATAGFCTMTLLVYLMPLASGEFMDSLWFLTSRGDSYSSSGLDLNTLGFNNVFFYLPVIIALLLLSCAAMAMSRRDRDESFLYLGAISLTLMFCFPFVSYTPTYGVVLMLPILILYSLKGRVAWIPWILTIFFFAHGLAHYWETWFYPLAAFTDLIDIADVVEDMGNGAVYRGILLMMSSSGMSLMALIACFYVAPHLKRLIVSRRAAA